MNNIQKLNNRFWSKVKKPDICWDWTACTFPDGYGLFRLNGKNKLAHRLSYEQFKGEIPKELQIDHLCRNRKCVNPDHLEAVTSRENNMRGIGAAAVNSKKTHCVRGHEFTVQNTIIKIRKYGQTRECRICHNVKNNKYYHKKRLQFLREREIIL